MSTPPRQPRAARPLAMEGAREVLVERAAVDPRLAVPRSQDHASDRRLPLTGAEVLSDLGHALHSLRRLRLVRMVGTGVDLQLRDLRRCELVLREHPLDRLAYDLGRTSVELLAEGALLDPTRVARVAVVDLRVELRRHRDLLRVDDDHEVTRVDMRCVDGLALASERVRDTVAKRPRVCPSASTRNHSRWISRAWPCTSSSQKEGELVVRRRRIVATNAWLLGGWIHDQLPLTSRE